jgi:hypothetical protein
MVDPSLATQWDAFPVVHIAPDFATATDTAAADWIKPRLSGAYGTVASVVPDGYSAYVRICHPANIDGRVATWADVARHTDRVAHPTMQWHTLVGSQDPDNFDGSLWPGDNPELGSLDTSQLAVLCETLARYTETPGTCYFGVWEGYGWIDRRWAPERPRLHHPGRDYIMLRGSLRAAGNVGEPLAENWQHWAPSPNLMWPADRAWFVGTEIDFNSTLVGGTSELIQDLLKSLALDAWTVAPDDSLAADGDATNSSRLGTAT